MDIGSVLAAPFTGGLSLLGDVGDPFKPKSQTSTTTTDMGPWSATQPYWKQVYGDVFAPGGMLQRHLTSGTGMDAKSVALLGGSRDYANRVLSGEFLDPTKNLALAQSLQRGMEALRPWDTQATQAGRYGSGAWAQGRGRQLADLQGNLYGQGLQQMTQMAQLAPSIWQSQFLPEQRGWDLYNQATALLRGTGQSGTTSQPYYTPGWGSQLLGAGGSALGMLGMAGLI